MPTDLLEELREALDKVDRPGSFYVEGSAPAVLPGLQVKGMGPVGLPLTARQAKELKKLCDQAPYGKGVETLVDKSVRRVWRLTPDRFSLTNPDWQEFLGQVVQKVQAGLGLEKQKLESHLYDLLLYEPGSFFLPHKDGEKLDRMVATLVLVLPSSFEGGELVVRHEGQEQTIDFGGTEADAFRIHYAAFYADCEHEVRPLRKGYRLCLVYNLTLAPGKKRLTAPRQAEHVEEISRVLGEWAAAASPRKLAVLLEHQYTQDGLTWDALKGVDRAQVSVLQAAGARAGCKVYLALLTLWESGSAVDEGYDYDYRYGRRGRWYDEYEEDDYDEDEDEEDEEEEDYGGEHEMDEVFDTSLTAAHFSDPEGRPLPISELPVAEEEVLDAERLREVKPKEEYEGYTGNEGMTLDRWYRHAAVFFWPEARHFEILCGNDGRQALPLLKQMLAKGKSAGARKAAAQKKQAADLAAAILARWPENQFARTFPEEEPKTGNVLKLLAALDDPALLKTYLGQVLVKDAAAEPGRSLAAVCQKYGWETFRPELLTVCRNTTAETLPRNVRLLEQLCSAKPKKKVGWLELCGDLGRELVAALEKIDQEKEIYDWRAQEVKRSVVLAGLIRALVSTEQSDLLERLVAHVLATPKKYPLTETLMPALSELRPWLKKNLKKPSAALSRLIANCREQLEGLTAAEPQPPADYRREANFSCKCADCRELKEFLEDPARAVHRFPVREDRRKHLEYQVHSHRSDLDLKTEKTRSPYTLVCTKNTASYKERLKKYHQDQEHLATVRAIKDELPG